MTKSIDKIKISLGDSIFKHISSLNKNQLEKQLSELKSELNLADKKSQRYSKLKDEEWYILYRLERTNEFKYAKGGGVGEKPLSYYKYETPKVTIAWMGKVQPLGRFKSAEEAMEVINKQSKGVKSELEKYSIVTPDKVIHLGSQYQIKYANGGGVGEITPELNKKVVSRAEKIYSQMGGKTKNDFDNAYYKAIIEFGYEPKHFIRTMEKIGAEYDEEYAKGGGVELTRGDIENKIEGLRLRIAKTKKQVSSYETTNRGKYNKLWQEKVVPLQKELDELSELWGKSKYAKGGGVGDIPSGVFYAKVKPLREGKEPLFVRVSPDSVGEYTAGYVVYHPSGSNKRVAYFKKGDFKNLIEQGDYSIINKSEIPSKMSEGGSIGSSFEYTIGGL